MKMREQKKERLYTILRMMKMRYGRPVVPTMDEYDVPLANASEHGYYSEMLDLLQAFIGKALKTNEFLDFAVMTGCLRIAKESIFTGTNNFISNTISQTAYSDYFGFTESEMQKLLQDTGQEAHTDRIKSWYNGYCFGKSRLYDNIGLVNENTETKNRESYRKDADSLFWF